YQGIERVAEGCRLLVILLLSDEQFLEIKLLPGEPRRILDRRADQPPPCFVPSLTRRIERRLKLGVAKEDDVERAQDVAALAVRPSNRVRVLEIPVFGVNAVNVEVGLEAA